MFTRGVRKKIKMRLYSQALESFKLSNGNYGDFFGGMGGRGMIHSCNYCNAMLYFEWRCHCNIFSLTFIFNCFVIHGSQAEEDKLLVLKHL